MHEGASDETGTVLTPDTMGSDFGNGGKPAIFQGDIITRKGDDHRVPSSRMWTDDGTWKAIMTAHDQRKT